jgi:hypothetical protein
MAERRREFVDSRLRRCPPDRASAVSYGQAGENALRFPHLAHRPAAVHKRHSATAARIDFDSGKGETFNRLRALAYSSRNLSRRPGAPPWKRCRSDPHEYQAACRCGSGSHGRFRGKGTWFTTSWACLPLLLSIRGLSPSVTRARSGARVKLTYGRRDDGCTNIPLAAGKGSGGRDQSVDRLFRPCRYHGRPPGSAGADQVPVDGAIELRAAVRRSAWWRLR